MHHWFNFFKPSGGEGRVRGVGPKRIPKLPIPPKAGSEIPLHPPGPVKKSGFGSFPVIPAKAGIQYFLSFKNFLDPGFHRGDD
jgi:hypothetical protein